MGHKCFFEVSFCWRNPSIGAQLPDLESLPLNQPGVPVFKRKPLEHTIIDNSTFSASQSYDDTVFINTQAGSQWDGLRHVVHEVSGRLYNGTTKAEITGKTSTTKLGIDRTYFIITSWTVLKQIE